MNGLTGSSEIRYQSAIPPRDDEESLAIDPVIDGRNYCKAMQIFEDMGFDYSDKKFYLPALQIIDHYLGKNIDIQPSQEFASMIELRIGICSAMSELCDRPTVGYNLKSDLLRMNPIFWTAIALNELVDCNYGKRAFTDKEIKFMEIRAGQGCLFRSRAEQMNEAIGDLFVGSGPLANACLTYHIECSTAVQIAVLRALQSVDANLLGRLFKKSVVVGVAADRKLTHWGCGQFLGLIYVVKPRLSRYSIGLR